MCIALQKRRVRLITKKKRSVQKFKEFSIVCPLTLFFSNTACMHIIVFIVI